MKRFIFLSIFILSSLSACGDNKQNTDDRTESEKEALKSHVVKSPPYNIQDYTTGSKNPPPSKQ